MLLMADGIIQMLLIYGGAGLFARLILYQIVIAFLQSSRQVPYDSYQPHNLFLDCMHTLRSSSVICDLRKKLVGILETLD